MPDSTPENKPRTTLMDLYHETVSLVCGAMGYRDARLRSEAHAVKLWELTLMWALNNRQPTGYDVLPTSEIEGEAGLPELALVPDEEIEAAEDQTDPAEV